jgi:hypothetical protein
MTEGRGNDESDRGLTAKRKRFGFLFLDSATTRRMTEGRGNDESDCGLTAKREGFGFLFLDSTTTRRMTQSAIVSDCVKPYNY